MYYMLFFLSILLSFVEITSTQLCDSIQQKIQLEFQGNIQKIEWKNEDSIRGLLLTDEGELYYTENGGKKWKTFKDFPPIDYDGNGGGVKDFVWGSNPISVLWVITSENMYVSIDFGDNFVKYLIPENHYQMTIVPHPTEYEWSFQTWWSDPDCYGMSQVTNCYFSFSITTNMGSTWNQIDTYVGSVQWSSNKVWWTSNEIKEGNQVYQESDISDQTNLKTLYSILIMNNTLESIVSSEQINFDVLDGRVIVSSKYSNKTGLIISVSSNEGLLWNIATFPPTLAPTHPEMFSVVSQDDRGLVVSIRSSIYSTTTSLFTALPISPNFHLLLPDVLINEYGQISMVKHQGFDSVWFSNALSFTEYPSTLFSFNSGGTWQQIDTFTNSCRGGENCFIQLDLQLPDVLQFISRPDVPDIILSQGNIGEKIEGGNMFLSRNAGLDWETISSFDDIQSQILPQYHIDEYGTAFISFHEEIKGLFKFSTDQGLSWESCQTVDNIIIDSFITQPNTTNTWVVFVSTSSYEESKESMKKKYKTFRNSKSYSINDDNEDNNNYDNNVDDDYGDDDIDDVDDDVFFERMNVKKRTTTTTRLGIIDWSNVFSRTCNGYDTPDEDESDYEVWTTSDGESSCILGASTSIVRRKRDAQCELPSSYTIIEKNTICDCQRSDYECDSCYWLEQGEEPFKCENKFCEYDPTKEPSDCQDTYIKQTGYHRNPKSICVGTTKYDRYETDCTVSSINSNNGIYMIIVVTSIAIVFAVIGFGLYLNGYI